jgi:hypothetical protein
VLEVVEEVRDGTDAFNQLPQLGAVLRSLIIIVYED